MGYSSALLSCRLTSLDAPRKGRMGYSMQQCGGYDDGEEMRPARGRMGYSTG